MGFHEVQFPTDISWGSSGGPGFSTSIITTDSGAEERVARWSQARRKYDVAESIKTSAELSELLNFYMARQGCAYGFRFKDWSDYATTANHTIHGPNGPTSYATTNADVPIAVGDGTTTTFQLVKNYTNGGVTRVRTITKPVSGTVKVAVNGVDKAGHFTVNTTTGVITLDSAPTLGHVVSAGFEFDVPVRFGDDLDDQIPISLDAYESGSAKVPMIEILDELPSDDEFFYGGAVELELTANYNIDTLHRVNVFKSTVVGRVVFLPDADVAAGLPSGAPWYYIVNDPTSTQSITLKDFLGNTVCTIAAGTGVEVFMSIDAVGTRTFYAF